VSADGWRLRPGSGAEPGSSPCAQSGRSEIVPLSIAAAHRGVPLFDATFTTGTASRTLGPIGAMPKLGAETESSRLTERE